VMTRPMTKKSSGDAMNHDRSTLTLCRGRALRGN
jgi:hypothetical protein